MSNPRPTWQDAAPINEKRIAAGLDRPAVDVAKVYVPEPASWHRQAETAYAKTGRPEKRRRPAPVRR